MKSIENEDPSEGTSTRERAPGRAIESTSLSNRTAGSRVIENVRNRLEDGSQRVVITNDERKLPRELVEHAFEALRYSGIVCAPDGDGGFALIGMTEPHDALMAAIPWGTSDALNALLSAARTRHVPVTLLPPAAGERNGSP
jgi:glycosyltransferase A (GT-A) superfamily protein (DUF2064 family)